MSLGRLWLSRRTSPALAIAALVLAGAALAGEARAAERPRARRPEVMSGTFSGAVVTSFVSPQVVQSWLPQGLQIDKGCPYPEHPVIVLFGSIDDLTREKVITVKPRFGRHYLETFVAVPYLKLENSPQSGPVFHFVRIYSDNLRGTTQGIRRYGWPKVYVPIQTTDTSYRILREGPEAVFDAQMDSAHSVAVDRKNDSLKRIQEMLLQPMVLKHEGVYHRYAFNFHFESANIVSLPVDFELRDGFLPQWTVSKKKIPGIAEGDFGAFHVECRYTKSSLN